jgi:hypothetical protein
MVVLEDEDIIEMLLPDEVIFVPSSSCFVVNERE